MTGGGAFGERRSGGDRPVRVGLNLPVVVGARRSGVLDHGDRRAP